MILIAGKWNWFFDEMKGFKTISKLPLILKFIKGRIKGPDDITKCTMCPNMCRHACPVGIVDGSETTSPSGKSRIGFFIKNDVLPMNLENSFPPYMCLSCGCCERWCPFDFSVSDILHPLKEKMIEKEIISNEFKTVFENLENYRNVYSKPKNKITSRQITGKTLYLSGCVFRENYPEISEKALKNLNNFSKNVFLMPEENCCGIPAYNLGNKSLFKKIVKENTEILNSSGADQIITSCPSCTYAYRVIYPSLGFEIEPIVLHILEFLNEINTDLLLKSDKNITITYHDPCKLANGLDKPDAFSTFLKNIKNIEVKNPRREGKKTFCCGYGGSSITRLNKNLADEIAHERIDELAALSSNIITACPSCKLALETNKGKDVKIFDVVELIDIIK